jgi:glycerol-3-phosphate dehydrogenase
VALNAVDARERGAEVFTRTRCVAARREGSRWVARLEARTAGRRGRGAGARERGGPWVAEFLGGTLGQPGRAKVRLVKGSHIVVPAIFDHDRAYILQNEDRRIVFAIPYLGRFTLIGTTDVAHAGGPGEVAISAEETGYLCGVVNRYFRQETTPADVVWSYSGVRPLYDDARGDPSAVTRDYVFDVEAGEGKAPLLSVFGGKITTYRKLAEAAVDKLAPLLGSRARPGRAARTCPGAISLARTSRRSGASWALGIVGRRRSCSTAWPAPTARGSSGCWWVPTGWRTSARISAAG